MSVKETGYHYLLPDCTLVDNLRHHGYEVAHLNNHWYAISPELNYGITMLSGVPIALYETSVFSLTGFAGLVSLVDFYKSDRNHPESNLRRLEAIRLLIHNVIPLTASGSLVRASLHKNLDYITDEIVALNYTPAKLPEKAIAKFRPITDYGVEPPFEGGPKMIDLGYATPIYSSLSDLPVKIHVDYTELDEKLAEAGKRIARRFDIPEQEIAPVDTTPGREYVEKARNFRDIPGYANVPDLAAAAANMLTCYNNAAYEDFRTAADQIEEMINEIGYTVVRGFDDTDPARIVKTL